MKNWIVVAMALAMSSVAAGADSTRSLGWVGNMSPAGGSTSAIASGATFNVYVQVWKSGVTDSPGQGTNINCELWWSEVSFFGGAWINPAPTAMTYNADSGNNDEYQVAVSPANGLYEYTARCTDETDSSVTWQQDGNGMLSVGQGSGGLAGKRGIWADERTIAWNTPHGPANVTYELHQDVDGAIEVPAAPGSGIPLTFQRFLNQVSFPKYPNIAGYKALLLPAAELANVPDILKNQLAVAVYSDTGNLLDATKLQLQGVLDDLYSYDGPLGVSFDGLVPTIRVWAPTARNVRVRHFATPFPAGTAVQMTPDPLTGIWEVTGDASWYGHYYWFEVSLFVDELDRVQTNFVTDPYAPNLSKDGLRGQIIDIRNDLATKPAGWDTLVKPPLDAPEDITVYELHVRDFSAYDETVAAAHRGTFKAFTYDGTVNPLSNGMTHLKGLADAGLSHVHLMPIQDFADIPEDPADRTDPDPVVLGSFAPDSPQQQILIGQSVNDDSFNWGYNPVNYGVPEGSYATVQNGPARILQLRELVQTLANNGLRVVMDVVYNHTSSAGQDGNSVLDKIVPGYYYRLTANGEIETSSCCNDTATEFDMAGKLMVDTAVRFVRDYKFDGFRFDLMSLHTVANMTALRDAVQALTLPADGIDGSKVYLYGEGWDTGSAKAKGLDYAYQWNVAGTGIGTFNDRIRDATHGGIDSFDVYKQGFATGQAYDWNGYLYPARFQGDLRYSQDRLRVGLAGNLQNYVFQNQNNSFVTGANFNGTGYTLDPQEAIQYVTKHDNNTLYDLLVYKAPYGEGGTALTMMDERVRMQNMALSVVGLAQGVPFFHAGTDILRSKSMDFNSYNSGDWFNQIDFGYQSNNFGIGLPPAGDNSGNWPLYQALLPDANLRAQAADIVAANAHFRELLQIRRSSKLFRMETEADVIARLRFHNTGSQQSDGLLVMELADDQAQDLDPAYENIVVLFNANKVDQNFTIGGLAGVPFGLHPVQQLSADDRLQAAGYDQGSGNFFVPARTSAVFVSPPAVDTDGDGVADSIDNCPTLSNPTQLDSNGDGFGNLCDPDLDNNGIVNFADLQIMKDAFFSTDGGAAWNADADLNGDGGVNFADLLILKSYFFGPPG